MPADYPRPFTSAWEMKKPHILIIGPRIIDEHPILPLGITFFEPPSIVGIIETTLPAVQYKIREVILAAVLGGGLGAVFYIILRMIGLF